MVSPQRVTRSPRSNRPALPRPAQRRASEKAGFAIALLIVGALAGVGIVGLVSGQRTAATDMASSAPSDDAGAIGTDAPEDSIAPVSPVLEARIPRSVGGTTLTAQSATDATSLSSGPDGRALNAAVVHLGKEASDLEIAYAYDESGSSDLVILGFRVDGVSATDLRAAVLGAWLAADTPGVSSTSLTWSGTDVTKLSYGDAGADEYVLTLEGSVFVVETVDAGLAQSAAAALVAAGGAPAPAPSANPTSS